MRVKIEEGEGGNWDVGGGFQKMKNWDEMHW